MEPLEDNPSSRTTTINVSPAPSRGHEYDPAYEWPGDLEAGEIPDLPYESDYQSHPITRSGQPVFRLVVLKSDILSKNQRIAVLDSYREVQLGRDRQIEGSTTPRVRLKEMEVSKLHATMYWDGARKEWSVVDMGSVHGTFLQSGPVSEESTEQGIRLSGPRAASIPRQLRHLDQLTVGSTTFVIHIHNDERPCQECSISGRQGLSISLFPPKKDLKRTRDAAGLDLETTPSTPVPGPDKDPRKALSMLKRSLLTRHVDMSRSASTSTTSLEEPREYLDRAERRRMMFPQSRSDSPGVPSLSSVGTKSYEGSSLKPEVVVSAPPTPLPSTNIGHQLLLRQGWMPGEALGQLSDGDSDRIGLVNPLEVKGTQNRSGIGNKIDSKEQEMNWKDREKMKRYQSIL